MTQHGEPGTEPAGAPPCFLRGTRILTSGGEVPVEELAADDAVATVGGMRRRVAWIGQRRIDLTRYPRPAEAAPVRVRRGAIANGMPARDLLLSPDHALLLNGVLIPVRALLNGATVLTDFSRARLDYFHVALEAHDVLLAEAAPAESFPDRSGGGAFGRDGVLLLHPGFADTPPAATDCAPRLARGPAAQEARRTLLQRARALGHALTRAPDLHLLADGVRINPARVVGPVHRFAIPPGTTDIRLVSRAGVPAETDPDSEDRRRLGVMLARLALCAGGSWSEMSAADASLTEGFHPAEQDRQDVWRWTDGHARLPAVPRGLTHLDLWVLGAQPAWARAAPPDAPMHRSA